MFVYVLLNKHDDVFYVGITKNYKNRLKQHKNNWIQHKTYIDNKEEIRLKIICDTGNNEYSKEVAERIETNLIYYYNTVNHGSNKIYNAKDYFIKMWENKNYKKTKQTLFNQEIQNKRNKTIETKKHKKFKTILKLIHDDPCRYTIDELIQKSKFKSLYALNNYTLKYHKIKFDKWLHNYQYHWNNNYIQRVTVKQEE